MVMLFIFYSFVNFFVVFTKWTQLGGGVLKNTSLVILLLLLNLCVKYTFLLSL